MNELPDESQTPADGQTPDHSQGDASREGAADAVQAGDETAGAEPGAKNRRRRRSRHKRGAAGEGTASEGGDAAPGHADTRKAPTVIDPAVREGAAALFGEVVSGAYDEQDAAEGADQGVEAAVSEGPSEEIEGEGDPRTVASDDHDEDEGETGDDNADHRRVLAPDPEAPKLHKVLAQSGVGSRRDLEAMIEAGRVTVNGEVAHTGQRVSHGDRIQIDGKPVRIRLRQGKPRVIAYHKPVGEVVTHDDPQQRPTVFRRLPRLVQGKWQSVGRLDLNTEGLLLFTNSGELANQLMHPRFGVEREYAVRVLGRLEEESRERLLQGVEIEGQSASFISIEDGGGEGVNHWYRVVLNEGRNREVRRLFESVGLTVSRLIRIRYGCVVLPRGLKRGAWVDLGERDVDMLQQLTGVRPRGQGRGAARGQGRSAEGAGPVPEGGQNKARRGRGQERGDRPGDRPGDRGQDRPRDRASDRTLDRSADKPRRERRERGEDGPIPSPLLQTYDKRAFKEEQRRPKREYGDEGPIPNPLQQTFDQRALKEAQRRPRREFGEDGPIPNPLQQTYDKRALQNERRRDDADDFPEDEGPIPNPLQQTFDKRFAGKGGAPGAGRGGRGRAGGNGGPGGAGGGQPRGRGPAGPGGPASGGPKAAGAGRGKGKGGGGSRTGAKGGGKGPAQPDPMRTAVGYIGADAALGRGKPGRGRRGR